MPSILAIVAAALLSPPLIAQGPEIPAPRGMVNDFAGVIGEHAPRIERIAEYVRERSGGELAIVTLRDIGGREAADVALRIGREWGVGLNAPVGDRRRDAGVVVLLVPKETASDGRGQISIMVGNGAEGFITDGIAGDIRREATPALRRAEYGAALELIAYRLGERYASEFGFSMDSVGVAAPRSAQRPIGPRGPGRSSRSSKAAVILVIGAMMLAFFVFVPLVLAHAGKRARQQGHGNADVLPWLLAGSMAQRRKQSRDDGSGWWSGGGGGFGGFGGGGGGFGGFGGGGGFSGGGSSGSF